MNTTTAQVDTYARQILGLEITTATLHLQVLRQRDSDLARKVSQGSDLRDEHSDGDPIVGHSAWTGNEVTLPVAKGGIHLLRKRIERVVQELRSIQAGHDSLDSTVISHSEGTRSGPDSSFTGGSERVDGDPA